MPKASAAIIASPVEEPLMSGEPIRIDTVPSGSTRQPAAAGERAPPHDPSATPTPSPAPTGAMYSGWRRAASRHSTIAMRGHGVSSAVGSPSRDALWRRSSIGSMPSFAASSSIADSSAK